MKIKVMLGLIALLLAVSLVAVACPSPATPTPTPTVKPTPTVSPTVKPTPTVSPSPTVAAFKWPEFITFAERPVGAKATRMGIGMAAFLEKVTPSKTKMTHAATTQRAWFPINESGAIDLTVDWNVEAWMGYFGEDPFPGRYANMRTVASAIMFDLGMGARGDSGIKSLSDVKGKRLAYVTGIPGGVLFGDALLAGVGLTTKDVTVLPVVNPAASVQALIEGRADVSGLMGSGMPIWVQAVEQVKAFQIPTDWTNPKMAETLVKMMPPGRPIWEPKGTAEGIDVDQWQVGTDGLLMTSKFMSDDQAYNITKVLYEQYDVFASTDAWFKTMTGLQDGRNGMVQKYTMCVPYHPGAIKFYKEKGLWTAAHQAAQDKLLKTPPEITLVPVVLPPKK